jgi:hypothetical protein
MPSAVTVTTTTTTNEGATIGETTSDVEGM